MDQVVNLRRERKRKERELREGEAHANRAKFGRPGSERRRERALAALAERRLDGHKRSE